MARCKIRIIDGNHVGAAISRPPEISSKFRVSTAVQGKYRRCRCDFVPKSPDGQWPPLPPHSRTPRRGRVARPKSPGLLPGFGASKAPPPTQKRSLPNRRLRSVWNLVRLRRPGITVADDKRFIQLIRFLCHDMLRVYFNIAFNRCNHSAFD